MEGFNNETTVYTMSTENAHLYFVGEEIDSVVMGPEVRAEVIGVHGNLVSFVLSDESEVEIEGLFYVWRNTFRK